ncbi:MAG TPA: sigma-54 dependent transcriptional regulator [Candidatus Angelobacter sp.]|nr:sigma-54 dependent transcriptional regulator [Candidatus Angelobacter sp.]
MTDDARVRFLIVDDHPSVRKLCMTVGASVGFDCVEAESAEAALSQLESDSPDIILADLMMPNMSGLEFLPCVKQLLPHAEIAIMTGHGSIETAVQAMKLGAYDYITKPFRIEELKLLLQRMAEKIKLVAENQFLRDRVSTEMELNGIVGSSSKIQDVLRMVARLKDTRTPVLITGESGTGKELVARAIHYRGLLSKRPFVAVDCGSLVPTLIESELFGYEKGAFTGALRSKEGLFQSANGGTIFLDEIGELSQELQAKLLRVLQEKEVRPVGSNQKVKVDVRVIAATNRDLEVAQKEGKFRKDLYFRLNVVTVHLPPLRERRSDVTALVHYFLDRFAPGKTLGISPEAIRCMLQYDWPGNVRELENCIERAVALGSQEVLELADLPPAVRAQQEPAAVVAPFVEQTGQVGQAVANADLEELERDTIQRVFEQVQGDKARARKMLGISRATLYRKLKRYNIGFSKRASAAS